MMVDDGLDTEEPIEDDVKELQDGNFYHPDFINLDDDNCSGMYAIIWDLRWSDWFGIPSELSMNSSLSLLMRCFS